jgi:branched-chain amino acid transport system substrate-binding protein
MEEMNARGGLNGRRIEMVTRDDKQDEKQYGQAIAELVEENVVGIVGPMTSAMAMVMVPVINMHGIPTISPTVSTDLLADKDDYFFRIIPNVSDAVKTTAKYAYHQKKYRKLFVVYDQSNRGYTEPWLQNLKIHYEEFADGEVESMGYISKSGYDFLGLAKVIAQKEMDCLVILANGLDTALISQQLAKLGENIPILACQWSLSGELIEFGGSAVEGIELFHSYDPNSEKPGSVDFNLKFQKRFGYHAGFASAYGYNAMNILLGALKEGTSAQQVKKNLLSGSPYKGVQREIIFNKYGDALREYSLLRIEHGKIITL